MVYLAMTAAELQHAPSPPEHTAWMACHFSPYGTGLTNIPTSLPPNSLLILNDRTPVSGHDPVRVADTLLEAAEELRCSGILLDFQRPDCPQTAAIAARIADLPCPVIISEAYARDLNRAVFLPPVPLLKTTEEYIAPWRGNEIWLELALDGARITVTENGSRTTALPPGEMNECPDCDMQLCCHYGVVYNQKEAVFTLKRDKIDLQNLMKSAEKLGITHAVGLWQELGR